MKNILIIYPHWPPSNLAGVHRARLISNFLPDFGWHPVVLTVEQTYYDEPNDWEMLKTVSKKTEVHYVKAFKQTIPRTIGDIGLRAFFQLKKAALNLIKNKEIDFIWIPIPSFYTAILGRIIFEKTKIPYGIDYIDPWIRDISTRRNFRAVISLCIAKLLEPYAVKKASLISGVSTAYYKPVLDRNFKNKNILHVGMPYGFDPGDHKIIIEKLEYPWDKFKNCIPFVYAGAFLPNSGLFIDLLFKSIAKIKNETSFNKNIKLFFLGTGNYSHKSIFGFAKEHKIDDLVIEIRERFPYLHILNYLSEAKGILLIGSTEKHYTASKTYQSLLSEKPVFSIMHFESSAVKVFEETKSDKFLVKYDDNRNVNDFKNIIEQNFSKFIQFKAEYNPDLSKLDKYSAKKSTEVLSKAIEKVL